MKTPLIITLWRSGVAAVGAVLDRKRVPWGPYQPHCVWCGMAEVDDYAHALLTCASSRAVYEQYGKPFVTAMQAYSLR